MKHLRIIAPMLFAFLTLLPPSAQADDSLNVQTLSHLPLHQHWEKTWDLKLRDGYAWIAGGDAGILVAETDPPVGITNVVNRVLHDRVIALDIQGDRLYALAEVGNDNYRLRIYDIADPPNLSHLGMRWISEAKSFAVWNNEACAVASSYECYLLDVRNPSSPTVVDTIDIQPLGGYYSTDLTAMTLTRDFMVFTIWKYDVNHGTIWGEGAEMWMAHYDLESGFDDPDFLRDVGYMDDRVGDLVCYPHANRDTTIIFSQRQGWILSEYFDNSLLSYRDIGNGPHFGRTLQSGVRIFRGNDVLLQMRGMATGLSLSGLDIQTGVERWNMPCDEYCSATQGDGLILAARGTIYHPTVKIDQWSYQPFEEPEALSTYDHRMRCEALTFADPYVVTTYRGLQVFEVLPDQTMEERFRDNFNGARGLTGHQWVFYVPCGENGLRVYNRMDIANPQLVRTVNDHDFNIVQTYDHYLYALGSDSLVIYDIANPGNPVQTGVLHEMNSGDPDLFCSALHIVGDYLYYHRSRPGYLKVFDLSDPLSPEEVHSVHAGVSITSRFHESGNSLLLPRNREIVKIDVSEPASPVIIDDWFEFPLHTVPADISVLWDRYFVTSVYRSDLHEGRITLWDTESGTPEPIAYHYNSEHRVYGAWCYGERMFAIRDDGLVRFDLSAVLGTPEKENDTAAIPSSFSLQNARPNPFNSSVTVEIALPNAGTVELHACNLLGRRVDRIALGRRTAGVHQQTWAPRELSSGVYFLQARTGDGRTTRPQKVVYIR
ncbi:T9SS type A sorting domain-containing protein [bacterium]|nr:T9SS type A sorting domain-containing protein [bacterium]